MRRLLYTLLGIVLTCGIVVVLAKWVRPIGSLFDPYNSDAANRMNAHMAALRDRVRRDPPDAKALDELIRSLQSNDSFEIAGAANFIGQIGPRAEPATDVLVQVLEGSNPYGAREAATALGEIGPSAKRAIPALLRAMENHPHADSGWFAAESLGKVADVNDQKVIEALEAATASDDHLLKDSAARGLRRLESRRSQTRPN